MGKKILNANVPFLHLYALSTLPSENDVCVCVCVCVCVLVA